MTQAAVQKAAKWTCVEIAVRDLSALPGQSKMRPIAVIARKGNNDVRHIPLSGAEFDPKQEQLSNMTAHATTAQTGKDLFEYLATRGIGGYSSCSDEFLIEASALKGLVLQLRQRGFPASEEV